MAGTVLTLPTGRHVRIVSLSLFSSIKIKRSDQIDDDVHCEFMDSYNILYSRHILHYLLCVCVC